jgi:hypothetical protein
VKLLSNEQRKWLVKYGIAVGARLAHKHGAVTLARIHAEMNDDGALDGFEEYERTWLLDVRRLGPFEMVGDGTMSLFRGALVDDYPLPGARP